MEVIQHRRKQIIDQPELFEHIVGQNRGTLHQKTQELEDALSKVEAELERCNVL